MFYFPRLCLILLSLIAALKPAVAQEVCSYSLTGKVIDEHDGQPLEYANIYIKELEKGGISDSTGLFKIDGICTGTYTVTCSHLGCESIVKTMTISGNTSHNFYPEHHAEFLREAVITGERTEAEPTQSEERLTEQELNETRGESLGESLTKVTGVTTLSTGNSISKPVIHGMHSNRILILNNGVRQEGQQWGNEHAPEIDPFIANELTVVKGANGIRYGPDAIAGVILVDTKPLRDSAGVGGEINLVGFSNGRQGIVSGRLDGNLAKIPALTWRLQGTYKRGGNVNAPNYYLKNTGLQEYNFSAETGYRKENFGLEVFYSQFNTDIGIFSASHIGNLTDLQRAFEAEEPLEHADFTYLIDRPWQHIEHELFKAKGYLYTGEAGKLSLTYARQYNLRFEYDKHKPLNDSVAGLNLPALQFEITTHTADLAWEHYRFKSFSGSFGVSGIQQSNTYEGRFFIPNFRKRGGGVFWIERWKPDSSKLELEAGVRFDYIYQEVFMWRGDEIITPQHRYNNVSGSFGGIYSFNDQFLLRANVGTAWRPPNVNELYSNGLHHGAAAVEIGDTSLVSEQAYSFSASAEYTAEKLSVHVDAYYNYIDNFIYLKPELPPSLTIRGAFPTFRQSQVDATLKGIDLTINYDLPLNLSFTSKSSILRAYNEMANDFLVLMPADRFENRLEYKLPNQEKLTDGYLAVTVLSVLEQTRVPVNSDFVAPPAGYNLLGIQAGFSLPVGADKMNVGIGVNNLLNTSYRDYLNRFRYYTDEMGTNVTLRLKIPFSIINPKSDEAKKP